MNESSKATIGRTSRTVKMVTYGSSFTRNGTADTMHHGSSKHHHTWTGTSGSSIFTPYNKKAMAHRRHARVGFLKPGADWECMEELLHAIEERKGSDVWEIFGRTLVSHI